MAVSVYLTPLSLPSSSLNGSTCDQLMLCIVLSSGLLTYHSLTHSHSGRFNRLLPPVRSAPHCRPSPVVDSRRSRYCIGDVHRLFVGHRLPLLHPHSGHHSKAAAASDQDSDNKQSASINEPPTVRRFLTVARHRLARCCRVDRCRRRVRSG